MNSSRMFWKNDGKKELYVLWCTKRMEGGERVKPEVFRFLVTYK